MEASFDLCYLKNTHTKQSLDPLRKLSKLHNKLNEVNDFVRVI